LKIKKIPKEQGFGSKTYTLEMVGLIIPFLIDPSLMKDRNILLTTDNIGCVFGWENKAVKGDVTASILVRSLAVISVYLNCSVHIRHERRKSSWGSLLADRLTRRKTTVSQDCLLLKSFNCQKVPVFFRKWLNDPKEDWDLVTECLSYVSRKVQ